MLLRIGELARRTGLTVRALHHYDAIGLLRPSARSASGYRLYDRGDIERLHRIQALRRLDLTLAEIGPLLDGGGADLETVVTQQLAALDREIERAADLRKRLAALQENLRAREEPDMDAWLATLSMMNFYDRYLTAEEAGQLRARGQPGVPEFNALREQLRACMMAGEPAHAPAVQALAGRWIAASARHLAGDARLMHKVHLLHKEQAEVRDMTGIDAGLLAYIERATAEFRLGLYARHLPAEVMDRVRGPFLQHYGEWPALFAQARELHERGLDAGSPEVLDLARRWLALFTAVWGEDPHWHQQVLQVNQNEPALMQDIGLDGAAVALVRAAIARFKNQKPNVEHS